MPYLAQPRVQLTSIAFANSFVNIAESLGNNRISFQLAYTQTTQDELTHYNLEIYGLFDRDSVLRYVGKNKSTLENRMNLNNWKVRMDPTSSPLYRYVQQNGGSFDGWTIRPIARITYDQSLIPDALVDAEDECIGALRRAGHPLLNKNKAKATRDRREYIETLRI